jgi:hypothetical protein
MLRNMLKDEMKYQIVYNPEAHDYLKVSYKSDRKFLPFIFME